MGGRADAGNAASHLPSGDSTRKILVTVDLEPSWRSPRAGTSGYRPSTDYRPSARTRRVVSALERAYDLRQISSWPIHVLGIHCVVFEVPEEIDTDAVLERLTQDERVESAQPMNVFETSSTLYNDPYRELQHGVTSMEIEEAHRWARGAGVEIAVIDTGIDIEHPELREHVLQARSFVEEDVAAMTPELHGTAVAGVIVSAADNDIGIVGVAPAARLLALRACWQPTSDSPVGACNSFTLAKALSYAVEQRPHILNLSLAGPSDPLLGRLVRAAIGRGIVVVAAASDDPESQPFPARIPGVLGVRSAGLGEEPSASVPEAALLAPGAEIITTAPAGGFDFHSGHSLATAHVSGVVALLLERRPDLGSQELLALLRDASRGRSDPASTEGAAMVNACVALARITSGPICQQED